MKTRILKIDEEQALNLYKTATPELKIILENSFTKEFFCRDIVDKIKTIDDVYKILGKTRKLPYDCCGFGGSLLNKQQKQINALYDILNIVEAYNEGTILNFNDTSVYKYLPYKYLSAGSWSVYFADCFSRFHGSAGQYYKSEKLAKDAYNKFKNIYEEYWQLG